MLVDVTDILWKTDIYKTLIIVGWITGVGIYFFILFQRDPLRSLRTLYEIEPLLCQHVEILTSDWKLHYLNRSTDSLFDRVLRSK